MQNEKKKRNNTLNISDDLNLTNIPALEISKNIFPDELNRYLHDQVQYLTHENGMLYKNLSDVELQLQQSTTKISTLTSQLDEHQTISPKNNFISCSTSNLASSKIVELSKKLRERNSEIEIYKSKCSKLQQYIFEIEKDKNKKEKEIVPPKQLINETEEQTKTLYEKLSSTNLKLCETRNSNIQLKNDLKLANKLLKQEVGDHFDNLQGITNSNWRGRAQTISDLLQKNNDLREKLKFYQDKEKGNIANCPLQITKTDKRFEILTKENEDLKNNTQEFKKKFEALKARNKVLESDGITLKAKIGVVMEQNERDHEIITSLTAKMSHAQDMQNEGMRQKQMITTKLKQENLNLNLEIAKSKCKIENLTMQLDEQRKETENLRNKNKNQQLFTPSSSTIVDSATVSQLEVERLRLLELTKIGNERLEAERIAHGDTQSKLRIERQKGAKLETKVARLQLDHQIDSCSSYSSCSLRSKDNVTLQDKLQLAEETIKALETRLHVERQEHKTDIDEFNKILSNSAYFTRKCENCNVEK